MDNKHTVADARDAPTITGKQLCVISKPMDCLTGTSLQ